MNDELVHASVLLSPAGEHRRTARARRRAAHGAAAAARAASRAAARQRLDAERAEYRSTQFLPSAGERRRAALRTGGRLRIPAHQDTSATWSGAYPFLAEGGLGADGVFIGQDRNSGSAFVYDPWVL